MQGVSRTQVVEGVSSKDPEVARLLRGPSTDEVLAGIGAPSELELNARELESVAASHRRIADDLDALAARVRGGGA